MDERMVAETSRGVGLVEHEGIVYGVNGWLANAKDRRLYNEDSDSGGEGAVGE